MRTGVYDRDKNTRPDHPALPGMVKIIQKELAEANRREEAKKALTPSSSPSLQPK